MPETWWLQASKMLDIEFLMTQESFWKHDFTRWPEAQFQIIGLMEDLGHHPFDFKQPNGYMDNEQEWISPEMMIRRLVYAKDTFNYFKSDNTKKDNFRDFLVTAINKNFDNPDEITNEIFTENSFSSKIVTKFLNLPEVLRV
jgi:uncharacterized protein (DUF1800 family)